MGLTIHYSLQSNASSPDEARRLVEALRQRALDLPFQSVGDVLEFEGDDCHFDRHENPAHRWLLVQSMRVIEGEAGYPEAVPEHVVALTTNPGNGSEPAHFGVCRYPTEIDTGNGRIPTTLPGWTWESFCKTQYASNPECGGIENFLRCNLSIIGLLDYAAKLGLLVNVEDESGFYEERDVEGLAAEGVRWNQGMAAFTGHLKDLVGGDFAAEITRFPNFERLEAEGRRHEEDEPGRNEK